ncbi:threonyl-tRNA synthetase [Histoplasma capsulatum var. duboisii H88]|uniref:threonine--tRNA ligase n=1 Tax=Ajellomyces capsulatus (strain H88) TaxID=544711 RepID=F0UFH8_AJEC8|nr:threonyl-tRNA synthetase [Histoplasma capsulatum var. duboisii H88]QSS54921.1 threonyl-tRNA synthetase [Histoplasma capsulatum var. duboisii H88]
MRPPNIFPGRWRFVPINSAASIRPQWIQKYRYYPASLAGSRNCSCTASQLSQTNAGQLLRNNNDDDDNDNKSDAPHHDTYSQTHTLPPADHRVVGTEQELFVTSQYSPGSPLFLPNGTHILNKLTSFLRAQYTKYGFLEVLTPSIYKKSLWKVSGHWQNYKDDMYEVRGRNATGEQTAETQIGEDESYGLKPMNCPGHCLLFKSQNHSYRELPLRYADFSPLHRNEISGSLSGLTRVRRFHQDDGHIFCRPQQIGSEIESALKFTDTVMRTFGFENYRLVLSTRPEKDFIGSVELWDSAERQLRDALEKSGRSWELNHGDGAFYGPKIDMQIQDSDGKFHQLSTIQLDMNLPQRFELEYTVPEGEEDYNPETPGKAVPVLIHRAIFGSLERFFALLIENYNGRWPFWLSPRQGIILTVSQDEKLLQAADDAAAKMSGYRRVLSSSGDANSTTGPPKPLSPARTTFRIDLDTSARSLGKKIREAKKMKYNLIFVLGEKNLVDGSVDVDLGGQMMMALEKGGVNSGATSHLHLLDDTPCWDFTGVPDLHGGVNAVANAMKMKMKVDDVYNWLLRLETTFH